MRRNVMLMAAALLLCLGPPGTTLAQGGDGEKKPRSCEQICADLAAQNCEEIDSMECNFFIMGCLSGCNTGKLVRRK